MKLTDHIYLVGSSCMGLSHQGDCNVYAVESRGDIALIDCGLDPSGLDILQNMVRDGLDPSRIRCLLLTHIHPDHAGAVPAFQKMGIPVFCSQTAAQVLRDGLEAYYSLHTLPDSPTKAFFTGTPRAEADRILHGGDRIALGDLTLQVISAPAHSPDSVCYLLELGEKKHLFSGDTLFYPGHINYFSGTLSCVSGYPEVIETLARTAPDGLYPGHALFTVDRAQNCTQTALESIQKGVLPPLKPYS